MAEKKLKVGDKVFIVTDELEVKECEVTIVVDDSVYFNVKGKHLFRCSDYWARTLAAAKKKAVDLVDLRLRRLQSDITALTNHRKTLAS